MSTLNRYASIQEPVKIDLTPMLDVVFIMLIFFIVTASFVREVSLALERPPEGAANSEEQSRNITVSLNADNQIQIDGRSIDHRSLRAYFERHKASNPEASVIISAHKSSRTHALVRVSDAARSAGLFNVVVANQKELPAE